MVAVKDDQDQFHGMEEQVCCRIIQHLRGTQPAYLPTTDEKSESEDQAPAQPRKKYKGTSSKLRTADTTVMNQVIWPHELIYTPSGQTAVYEALSKLAFVNGYLSVLTLELKNIKARMLTDLQEVMEDGEPYGWPVVWSYHVV